MSSVSQEHGGRIEENLNIDDLDLQEYDCKSAEISYEYKGYQIRLHFSENKTLFQCLKNLTERVNEKSMESSVRVNKRELSD